MFSVDKFCFAQEDPGIYSVSHVSSTGIEAEQKSMPLWSFRKCQVSIKEAIDKRIKLGDTPDHVKKRGPLLILGESKIKPGDPRLNLFRVLGPDDNPFTEERNELSVLLAEKEEDLEAFANESWKHLDIFGSSTNLVRALQKLEKDIIGGEVKGDFYRVKAALKLLIPSLEVKGKGQNDLSRVLEDYCNKISTGTIPEPEIPKNLRYTLIRLNYGCERGDPSVVAFRYQFTNSTTRIKAYPRKTVELDTNGNPIGEETVLIPNSQIGKPLNYKTMCLLVNESRRDHRRNDSPQTFIGRIMPRKDGTDLEVTPGGTENQGSRSHKIMETDDIRKLIDKCHIPFTETEPEPDGSKHSGQRSRILINLDKIGTLDCYDPFIKLFSVSPKVLRATRTRTIRVSNLLDSENSEPSHWLQSDLFGEAVGSPLLNKLSADEKELIYGIFGIDCSFLTKKAERNKILKERAEQSWDRTLSILQDQFGDFYKEGVSLIVPRVSGDTNGYKTIGTVDCVTPPIGRYLLQSYRNPNLVKVNNATDVPGISDPVTDSLGKALKSNDWDRPWSSIERTYLLPQNANKSMVDITFLPTQRSFTMGRTPKGRGWDSSTLAISPLVSLFIGLGKTLIKDGTLRSSTCKCGAITTREEWDEIGTIESKSHNCTRCSLFKSIVLHLFSAFIQDRTVRGSYLEWWKPGKGHLDMRKQISNLFSPSSGLSENLPKEIHLVYHKGAIVDDPRLRYYCGKDDPNDKRSAEPAGATSGAETPDSN